MRGTAVILALVAALAGACSALPERSGQKRSTGHPFGEEVVIVLPKSNSKAGAVVVYRKGRKTLLNKPYATARIRGDGTVEPATANANSVKNDFGAAIAALPPRPAAFRLYFEEGNDELTGDSVSRFDDVLSEIDRHPAAEITVTGHTDAEGSFRYNDKLAYARATRVREVLVERGVSAERIISVVGRGEREPEVPTAEGVPEARNRRVEISVR